MYNFRELRVNIVVLLISYRRDRSGPQLIARLAIEVPSVQRSDCRGIQREALPLKGQTNRCQGWRVNGHQDRSLIDLLLLRKCTDRITDWTFQDWVKLNDHNRMNWTYQDRARLKILGEFAICGNLETLPGTFSSGICRLQIWTYMITTYQIRELSILI